MGFLQKLAGRRRDRQAQRIASVVSAVLQAGDGVKPNGAATASATYMACVDCHCRHLGKARFAVFKDGDPIGANNPLPGKDYLQRILGIQPNPHQTATQVWRSLWRDYFLGGAAVAWLEFDRTAVGVPLRGIWPLDMTTNGAIEFTADDSGKVWATFQMGDIQMTAPEDDLIILVRHPTTANPLGSRDNPLSSTLQALDANRKGLVKAIEMSHVIRFVMNVGTMINDSQKRAKSDEIARQLASDQSGVLVTSGAESVTPITSNPTYASADAVSDLVEEVYAYQGVSPAIVKGSYTEDQFQAYWEGTLEPALKELGEQLTIKALTPREVAFGETIEPMVDSLQTISTKTRINLAQTLLAMPIIRTNQVLRVLGLDPIEGGDRPVQNLNFVSASGADQYQGTEGEEGGNDSPAGGEETQTPGREGPPRRRADPGSPPD